MGRLGRPGIAVRHRVSVDTRRGWSNFQPLLFPDAWWATSAELGLYFHVPYRSYMGEGLIDPGSVTGAASFFERWNGGDPVSFRLTSQNAPEQAFDEAGVTRQPIVYVDDEEARDLCLD